MHRFIDDEGIDDEGNEYEEVTCGHCSGSGEGMYDGTRCIYCKGSGIEYALKDDDDDEDAGIELEEEHELRK